MRFYDEKSAPQRYRFERGKRFCHYYNNAAEKLITPVGILFRSYDSAAYNLHGEKVNVRKKKKKQNYDCK